MHKMERAMDMDIFLGAQDQWAKDSPHCLTILHKMFLHAAFEGQKKAEWIVCLACWWHMPQLNPEVVPTIQLVWLETSREELLDIYLEVYKLHRLPSSPPGELAILEEVSAAIPDPSWEEEETPDTQMQPSCKDFYSSSTRTLLQKRETSVDKSLEKGAWSAPESLVSCCNLRRGDWKAASNEKLLPVGSKAQKSGLPEIGRNEGGKMLSGSFCKQAHPQLICWPWYAT